MEYFQYKYNEQWWVRSLEIKRNKHVYIADVIHGKSPWLAYLTADAGNSVTEQFFVANEY